jgi:hypothetical protein
MAQNDSKSAPSKSGPEAERVVGVMPGGGVVPLRLPAGALNYLDRNQYISNMEIISYFPSVNLMIFGDEHSCMWVRGTRRLIAFQDGWMDITDPLKATVIRESGLGTFQSCVYSGRLKKWIRVISYQMPLTPGTPQYPRGKYHAEYARKAIEDPGFRGIKTFDVTNPEKPEPLDEFETGRTGHGVHAPFYDGGQYAYLACGWDDQLRMESTERVYSNGLMIVDMSDPTKVKEVSRWWVPGQKLDEGSSIARHIRSPAISAHGPVTGRLAWFRSGSRMVARSGMAVGDISGCTSMTCPTFATPRSMAR